MNDRPHLRLLLRLALLTVIVVHLASCRREAEQSAAESFEESSPAAEKLADSIGADTRIPNAINVSGAWTSGPNFSGYTVRLEQQAEAVTGAGYDWGCTGVSGPFTVRGTYRDGTLALRFFREGQPSEPRDYQLVVDVPEIALHGKVYGERDVLYTLDAIRRWER